MSELAVANRIKALISERGISYRELERQTGISSSSLQRYAVGKTAAIPGDKLGTLAFALGTSERYLLYGEAEPVMRPVACGVRPDGGLVFEPDTALPVPLVARPYEYFWLRVEEGGARDCCLPGDYALVHTGIAAAAGDIVAAARNGVLALETVTGVDAGGRCFCDGGAVDVRGVVEGRFGLL